jgi:hypothetical protein
LTGDRLSGYLYHHHHHHHHHHAGAGFCEWRTVGVGVCIEDGGSAAPGEAFSDGAGDRWLT